MRLQPNHRERGGLAHVNHVEYASEFGVSGEIICQIRSRTYDRSFCAWSAQRLFCAMSSALANSVNGSGEEDALAIHSDSLDTAWVLVCAMLIFLMQLGFAMLEAGSVQEHSVVRAPKGHPPLLPSSMPALTHEPTIASRMRRLART